MVNALAPAEVTKVVLDEERRAIEVVVPEDQLSLAIGRRGQNVRLASQLTGWDIDILTEDEESERRQQEFRNRSQLFIDALDVDDVLAHLLVTEGFTSVEDVAFVPMEDLLSVEGFDEEIANELRARAQAYLTEQEKKMTDTPEGAGRRRRSGDRAGPDPRHAGHARRGRGEDARRPGRICRFRAVRPRGRAAAQPRISEDDANAIIMACRAHWFADERGGTGDEDEDEAATGRHRGRSRSRATPMLAAETSPDAAPRPASRPPCGAGAALPRQPRIGRRARDGAVRRLAGGRSRSRCRRPPARTRFVVDGAARYSGDGGARGAFQKAARARVQVAPDLAERVEGLLARRCLDLIGMARRAGLAVCGFEKVRSLVAKDRAGVVIQARDAAPGGRDKLRSVAAGRARGGAVHGGGAGPGVRARDGGPRGAGARTDGRDVLGETRRLAGFRPGEVETVRK